MIKAASLYIVLVIALLIAVISSSLIAVAYFYRLEYQKKERFDHLADNLNSGITFLLAQPGLYPGQKVDLYDEQADSISLSKEHWGMFYLNTVSSYTQTDSLKKTFLSADSLADASAIYLADEDRPLSVSGKTRIIGNAELPKSGIKPAYVDGKAYEGKELVKGAISNSKRGLPELDGAWLDSIKAVFAGQGKDMKSRDVKRSFFEPELIIRLQKNEPRLENASYSGRIILVSDTVLTIAATVNLQDVQVYAPGIILEEGFKGSCQLFARDSIIISENSILSYPSAAMVLKPDSSKIQPKIVLGENSRFAGILCTYEKQRSAFQTMISLAKDSRLEGQAYATGFIRLERTATVYGKVYCNRFIMKSPSTLYENYLIDITLDRRQLSGYYLTSGIFKINKAPQKVQKWLE